MSSALPLALAVIWAGATIDAETNAPQAIVPFAVTIEGTASIEVTADTCVAAFVIARHGPTDEEAFENLKSARKTFASAVRGITGGSVEIKFDPPALEHASEEGKTKPPRAAQTARVRMTGFPGEEDDFNTYLSRITQAVFKAGVVPAGVSAPKVHFEVSRPQAVEEQLAKMAFADARKRADLAAAVLGRQMTTVRAGYFPSGVTVDGKFVSFSTPPAPATAEKMRIVITYTIQVAFELEL